MAQGVNNRLLLKLYVYLVCIVIILPVVVLVSASFTKANYVSFPPELISFKWWIEFFTTDVYRTSTLLSLQISAASSVLCVLIGLLTARAMVRYRFRGQTALSTLFNMPFTVPQVVFALAGLFYLAGFFDALPCERPSAASALLHEPEIWASRGRIETRDLWVMSQAGYRSPLVFSYL